MEPRPAPPEPSPPGSSLLINVLGGFAIRRDGELLPPFPTQKCEQLLGYLALHSDRDVPREPLAGLFWPQMTDEAARQNLRTTLKHLRDILEPQPQEKGQIVAGSRVSVRFVPPPGCQVDAVEFRRLAAQGLKAANPGERVALLETAVGWYHGPLLPGCELEWCEEVRRELEAQHEECFRALVDAHKAQNHHSQVVKWARRALDVDPWNEEYHREVMLHLWLMGDRAGVREQFAECRRQLAELELDPSTESAALYEELITTSYTPPPSPSDRALGLVEWVGPLIGRHQELSRLWQAWSDAGHGVGQLVFVSGEPGIGKSRLGQELLQLVEGTDDLPVYGQGYSLGRSPIYWPLTDALRGAVAVARRRSLKLGTPQTLARVARLLPELRELFPDLPASGSEEESELFDGLCRFFLDLARQRRLCLFMDDLQWADDATLRFLHYLWRHAADAPLLLVAAFREAEARENTLLVRWRREVEARHAGARLALPRLNVEAVEELLRNLAGDGAPLPVGLPRLLHQETDGNPLFLIMTLRALFDEGLLARDERGGWRPSPALQEVLSSAAAGDGRPVERLPVSPSIRACVLERVERLDPPERRLLEAASVLGQSFDSETLGLVAEQSSADAMETADRLLRLDLLREEVAGNLGFPHDRIREVVYDELSQPRRQRLHLRAGQALEAQLGSRAETRAAELAGHFLRAPQPQGAGPAVLYLLAAGQAALSLSAYQEAIRHLTTAVELLDTLPDDGARLEQRGEVVWALARAHRGAGASSRGAALLQETIDRCRSAAYPAGEARGCARLADFLLIEVGTGAERRQGAERHQGGALSGPTRVEILFRRAIALCVQHGLDTWMHQPRLDLAFYYWRLRPNLAEQEQLVADVVRNLDRLEPRHVHQALTMQIGIHGARDQWEQAREAFALALAHGGPYPLYLFQLLAEWEERLEREGRRDWFMSLCREWQDQARAAGCRHLPAQWLLEATQPHDIGGLGGFTHSFSEGPLPPDLVWVDPLGAGPPASHPGEPLKLMPPEGLDLWPHNNLNAPRLLVPVDDDFVAETHVTIGEEGAVAAGLLLWVSDHDYVRLERADVVNGDGIQMEARVGGEYLLLGRGWLRPRSIWLRLERFGGQVRGLCSEDREQWWACGSTAFRSEGPVKVGLACIAQGSRGSASFDQLTVWSGVAQEETLCQAADGP
jgi:DNA-binding SARP family transcriptional activator/tetratricopeptide (TPR) repeat protein/regulation of enolase protein 1 (concanavalin A-like superfamily)